MKSFLLLLLVPLVSSEFRSSFFETSNRQEGDKIILTAHGMGIDDVNRVVIPVSNGRIPPLPCVTSNAGTHPHGSTFTKNNFHYTCNNGTAEVVACLADDGSVIQLGRTFVRSGMKHYCSVLGDNVTYKQESMCYENGMHYNVGDSFRNGSFKLTCREQGLYVEGCYMQNSFNDVLMGGESRIENGKRHECEIIGPGKVRYVVKMLGCMHEGQQYSTGQMWTHQHVRYQCKNDGTLLVLGCIDEGLFIELGRDLLMNGMAHRCYQVDTTVFYHKFACERSSLSQCVAENAQRRFRRHQRA
uniref:Abnormal cell migration protein 18-like fibronectin type I domain-containing protein n=1 Tax=Caenorhabditis japonica TaxID=281687 RepID=A0A8R1DHW8_CAEJA